MLINCIFIEKIDFQEVFKSIASNEVDAGVVNNTFGAGKSGEYDLRSSGIVLNPFDIHLTVHKNKNAELLNLFDKYLDDWLHDVNSVYNISRQKWTQEKVGIIPIIPKWLKNSIFSIIGITIFLVLFVILLRKRVKKATIKIKESETKFRILADNTNDWEYWLDENNKYIFISPSCKGITGYSKEYFYEKPDLFIDLVRDDYKKEVSNHYRSENKRAPHHTLEFPIINKNNEEVWIEHSCIPIFDENGKFLGRRGNNRDITDRIITREKQRSSQEMLLSSQSVANICSYSTNLIVTDIDKSQWECSPEFYKIFGIDKTYPHTIKGWIGFLHPDYREDLIAYHESVVLEKKSFNREYKIIRINDGVERWVHGTGELEYDENGNPIRMYGAIQDITKRKMNEIKLKRATKKTKESEKVLITTLQTAMDGYWVVDMKGRFLNVNDSYCRMSGYNKEDLLSMHISDIEAIQSPGEIIENIQRIKQLGQLRFETKHVRKDGTLYDVEIGVQFQESKNGQFVCFIKDISAQKQHEKDLIYAKEKAEESDKLKSAFLANMSHEIRTPMNGILGFSELLKTPHLSDDEQQKYIRVIEKSGNRMLNIINDIVDISKIEAGLIDVNFNESNINEQIEYIYTFFKPEVEGKGMQLFFKNGLPTKQATIKTDREKVFAILTNLVKNAIKYSNEGSIEFGYVLKTGGEGAEQSKKAELEFFIKDTGIGVPNDRQSAIFERFIQADILDKMARQGAGLGLSITKSYIEMLGGQIWLESEEGVGSTFYFTLPYTMELEVKNSIKDIEVTYYMENQVKNLKILIAEDDEVSSELLSAIVSEISHEIIKARTGTEAVEICRNNPDIDLILMDIQMPEMNGIEATRQIKKFNKDVIIIAQTAFGLIGDREKSLDAGCNDYITKPINKLKLESLIEKYFKK